ncbi:hypothetical protein ACWGHA_26405 [Streptomyces xanthophaeus]
MSSTPSTSSASDGTGPLDAFQATYEEMLDKAAADIELLRRAVRRRQKALRRQNRRKAVARAATYGRPAMTVLGILFFSVGVVMLTTGHTADGIDMIDRALMAWSIVFGLPAR